MSDNATQLETKYRAIVDHPAEPEHRVLRRASIGDVVQQGDCYLHRVPADHPRGDLLGTRQIAVGEGEGSRHVVVGDSVQVFAGKAFPAGFLEERPEMLGPVIVSTEPVELTHPVHPHHTFPAGTWQVTYPWDHKARRRVAD